MLLFNRKVEGKMIMDARHLLTYRSCGSGEEIQGCSLYLSLTHALSLSLSLSLSLGG